METSFVATVILSFWPIQDMADVRALVKAGAVSKRWHRGSVDALHIVLCGLQNTVDRLFREMKLSMKSPLFDKRLGVRFAEDLSLRESKHCPAHEQTRQLADDQETKRACIC